MPQAVFNGPYLPPHAHASPGPGDLYVEATLRAAIESGESVGYVIYLHEHPDISPAYGMDWIERGRFVSNALRETAKRSQAQVRAYLDERDVDYRTFWIDNVIVVETSSHATFEGLQTFPEIEALRSQRSLGLIEPDPVSTSPNTSAIETNITHVQADRVWNEFHVTGADIVVANIDTGVRHTHQALVKQYRGNLGGGDFEHAYNWLDPASGRTTPFDEHGHGSHTMGIIVGDDGGANRVGMAPGAQWIACDACAHRNCSTAAILTCAEWIVAPYPEDNPEAANADLRPHVVNNSWGGCHTAYDPWFQGVVDAWHAAGIYPVFSSGNVDAYPCPSSAACGTVGNPARYGNVTAVGSTGQSNGQLASHSLWGPTDNLDAVNPRGYPDLKPQVVAPGVGIRSAHRTEDNAYTAMSGTSMSAPHVAGLVALMWQAAPCLVGNYPDTETLIEQSATPIPHPTNCGSEGPDNAPNYATGWGEIDAYASVRAAIDYCGADWLPWVDVEPAYGILEGGDPQQVTVTFTCNQTSTQLAQPILGTLRFLPNDPDVPFQDVDLVFYCSGEHPIPRWEKEVWINDRPTHPATGPYIVRAEDTITVVDRVRATCAQCFSATLTETWGSGPGSGLKLIHYETDGAGVVTRTSDGALPPGDHHGLVWRLTKVTPDTSYHFTKTFEVQYGDWSAGAITGSYTVDGAAQQLTDTVVNFHPYRPAIQLKKSGRATANSGEIVPITLTLASRSEVYHAATLTDVLPPGLTYAGHLSTTHGHAWHSDGVIHWTCYTGTEVPGAPGNYVMDGGFEGGTPNPYWEESSSNFGTPICNTSNCNVGEESGAHTGDWWVWFGGISSYDEIGSVAQEMFIARGKAELSFWLKILSAQRPGYLTVSIDESPVFSTTEAEIATYRSYQPVILDVSRFADGDVHILRFDAATQAGGYTNFFVDDVALDVETTPLPSVITITFDVKVTGAVGEIIRNRASLDWQIDHTTDAHDVHIVPDDLDSVWEQSVYVNGKTKTGRSIIVTTDDVIQVVDRLWISDTDRITFTLAEAWTPALKLLTQTVTALPGGTLLLPGGTLAFPNDLLTASHASTWTVTGGPAEWTYAHTKTFVLTSDVWGVEHVIATLALEDRYRPHAPAVIRFLSGVKAQCYLPLLIRDH